MCPSLAHIHTLSTMTTTGSYHSAKVLKCRNSAKPQVKPAGREKRRSKKSKKDGNCLERKIRTGRISSYSDSRPIPTPSPSPTRCHTTSKLACPFQKFDSSKYHCSPFASVAGVRQHIETVHHRPEYCPRCYTVFRGDGAFKSRRDHIVARECKLDPGPNTVEGLQGDLMDRLCEWEPVAGATPREQWEEIWRIVFPGDPVPASHIVEARKKDDGVLDGGRVG
ncbi:hypothetical protein QBC38DRAFT_492524 [Podospora fimiseda]|uniref:C2H2-type domain-containing protein n=1 Tax=Podospora fimiseda TaxID=252190 RepID=A0AAN6YLA9_9PEZI|nr:hypothetical protein QBC38DRAFT_492524 [Podospora fimiseda]